jgi:ATP-dependent helicase/nuclease subunit A
LDLERASAGGVAQDDLLHADTVTQRDRAGLDAYNTWLEQRARVVAASATPSLKSTTITAAAASGESLAPTIGSVIDTQADRQPRPGGARFGTLVHGILAALDFGAAQPDSAALARTLGRQLSASEAEIAASVALLDEALKHGFFERVRAAAVRGELWREAPVSLRSADGELLDGVADLVFRENGRCVLVDFKTDATLGNLTTYARQLDMYARALELALGVQVESVLLRV